MACDSWTRHGSTGRPPSSSRGASWTSGRRPRALCTSTTPQRRLNDLDRGLSTSRTDERNHHVDHPDRSRRGHDRAARQAAEGLELRGLQQDRRPDRRGERDLGDERPGRTRGGHPRRRHRHRPCGPRCRPDRGPGDRDRLRARASRDRPAACRRGAARRRVRRGRCRAAAVRGRQLRCRHLGDRRDVRRRPRPRGRRAGAGGAARWPDRRGVLDQVRVRRRHARDRRTTRRLRPVPSPRSGGARRRSSPRSSATGSSESAPRCTPSPSGSAAPRRSPTCS